MERKDWSEELKQVRADAKVYGYNFDNMRDELIIKKLEEWEAKKK